MAPYIYSPVDEAAQEIRLMTLLPGTRSSDIRAVLEHFTLSGEHKPQYEALSYVWGSAENLVSIYIGESNETLHVTRNLATALPYLRYEDRPRRLWIDAICVDQQNLAERSSQVLRMGDVYQLAERVVVWLGPEDKTSSLAMDTLRTLSSTFDVDWISYHLKPRSHEDGDWSNALSALHFGEETWQAISDLVDRAWFERLWVHQEIRLANHAAVVMCGLEMMLWQQFCNAAFCALLKPKGHYIPSLSKRLDLVFQLRARFDSIERLMQATRSCKCSDPRDRVYAILTLAASVRGKIDVKPDYTKEIAEVYEDFTLKVIDRTSRVDILTQCTLEEELTSLPSWVPNWSTSTEIKRIITPFLASGSSAGRILHKGKGILKATGLKWATINNVRYLSLRDKTRRRIMEAVRELTPPEALIISNSYIGGGSLFDAYCRTLCCDDFAERYIPPHDGYPKLRESIESTYQFLINQSDALLYDSGFGGRYWGYVFDCCQGRSLITTKEGFIGLAPKTAEANDIVCIILGCSNPLVLRATGAGSYRVVGDCYVHGLMDGQALLGPLPGQLQHVLRYTEGRGHFNAYVDYETGESMQEDPRLGPLPAGWRKKRHAMEKHYSLFERDSEQTEGNKVDTEWTVFDPRLSPEALAARNVALVDFELV